MLRSTIIFILSFVNDCTLSKTGTKFETVHDILRRKISNAQIWNNLIREVGGALELNKYFIRVIFLSFSKSGKPNVIEEVPDLRVQLIILHNKKKINIKLISAYSIYIILGTIQEIDEKAKLNSNYLPKNLINIQEY